MRDRHELIRDTEPFPSELIQTLPGRGGSADYVEWNQYAQRLLLQHGPHRYSVSSVTHADNMWAVSVRIQFSDDEWYDGVGQGDEPTHAESNAYKRALAKAGIGLHLYGGYWLHDRLLGGRPESPSVDEGKPSRPPSSEDAPLEYDHKCPDCGHAVYDNRQDNIERVARGEKRTPPFKCTRLEECGWMSWSDNEFVVPEDDPYDVEAYG